MIAGTVVEVGKLLEVVVYALVATVGVALLFSVAIVGAMRASEQRSRRAAVLGYGTLAALCLGGCIAAAAYGLALLASK